MPDDISWILPGAVALLVGAVLGTFFFVGLWWTVNRGARSAVAGRWFFGSMALRMAIVLAGFYAIGAGHPERLVLCLLGFVLARTIVLRRLRTLPAAGGSPCN
jgi:F1F0 ATPase subunit 2